MLVLGTMVAVVLNTTYTRLAHSISLAQEVEIRKDYPVRPVPFTDVRIDDSFWRPRMETHRNVTIPYCFQRCEDTGRIDNFAIAGGLMEGKYRGARYNDSDLYKVIEGAAYSLSLIPNPELEEYVDDVIVKIAAAQEDGYLSTLRIITPNLDISRTSETPQHQLDMYGDKRWARTDHGHELYCVGHMYEAAVAHYLATGKKSLLNVAIKNADLVCSVFGPDRKRDVPGHQEIEIGLVKLYRVTGNQKYLDMAKFFLDERGHYNGREVHGHKGSITYCQDHKPVIEQTEPVGHVVRAMYMYSGMADAAAITGDRDYIKAIDRIWNNIVSRKLYLTASCGVRGYAEGFGENYMLPNLMAFNETCASVGNAMWNYRMFLLHEDAKYIDVLERVLYNAVLSGVSMDGNTFFYSNPLASDGKDKKHVRQEWYKTACCPSNIARFMPSLGGYAYAHRDDVLYVNLFIGGSATVRMSNNTVVLKQQTDYPWDGAVKITVEPKMPARFTIKIRIPGWARNQPVPSNLYRYMNQCEEKVTLKVNGRPVELDMDNGFAQINRKWEKGDIVELNLPMTIRRVLAHEKVKDDLGKVALERGPIVYCAEWVDNKGQVNNLVLPDSAGLKSEYRKDMLNGVVMISGNVPAFVIGDNGQSITTREQKFVAIPYYAWAHRGQGEMAVWLPRKVSNIEIVPTEN